MHLADLIAEDSFGLELLSGGVRAGDRAVRGAHAVEVDAPARWLGTDWVMLTTGVRLRGNVEAQRALVPQLEEGGVSALGFGVGLGFKRVPPALVEIAEQHAFPVFAVPLRDAVPGDHPLRRQHAYERRRARLPPPDRAAALPGRRTPHAAARARDGRSAGEVPRRQRGAARRRGRARDRRRQAARRRAARGGVRRAAGAARAAGRGLARGRDTRSPRAPTRPIAGWCWRVPGAGSSPSSPSRPPRRRRRCSPRWRGSATSCATRSRRSRPRCSRRRWRRTRRATSRLWPRAPPRSGSTSPRRREWSW